MQRAVSHAAMCTVHQPFLNNLEVVVAVIVVSGWNHTCLMSVNGPNYPKLISLNILKSLESQTIRFEIMLEIIRAKPLDSKSLEPKKNT